MKARKSIQNQPWIQPKTIAKQIKSLGSTDQQSTKQNLSSLVERLHELCTLDMCAGSSLPYNMLFFFPCLRWPRYPKFEILFKYDSSGPYKLLINMLMVSLGAFATR